MSRHGAHRRLPGSAACRGLRRGLGHAGSGRLRVRVLLVDVSLHASRRASGSRLALPGCAQAALPAVAWAAVPVPLLVSGAFYLRRAPSARAWRPVAWAAATAAGVVLEGLLIGRIAVPQVSPGYSGPPVVAWAYRLAGRAGRAGRGGRKGGGGKPGGDPGWGCVVHNGAVSAPDPALCLLAVLTAPAALLDERIGQVVSVNVRLRRYLHQAAGAHEGKCHDRHEGRSLSWGQLSPPLAGWNRDDW
jgi:hypothetical protein